MRQVFDGVFEGMTVLVTGHTGFKGSWLSIWLRELGAKVVGYSLEPPTDPSNFELCGLGARIEHVHGDTRELEPLLATLRTYRPDVVIHLAAQPIVLTAYRDPKLTIDTNVTGTVNVLEAIRRTSSVRALVAVTTDKVYEDQGWFWGYRENDQLGGFDPYSASKAMAELAVRSYRQSWQQRWMDAATEQCFSERTVGIATARAGNVIGGGDFAKYRLVPDSMKALALGAPIEVRSPSSIRPWEHLLEPLSGYLWLAVSLLRDPDAFGEAWNFGPAERVPITCEHIAEEAIRLWGSGSCKLGERSTEGHEASVLRVSWDKAASRLGWGPTYTWKEALAETVEWWKAYQRQLGGSSPANMYDVCVAHIHQYVTRAQELGIRWATG